MQVIGVGAQVARAGEGNGRCRLLCATAMKEEAGGGGCKFCRARRRSLDNWK